MKHMLSISQVMTNNNLHPRIIELTEETAEQYGALCGFEGVAARKRSWYFQGITNRIEWYRKHYHEGLRIAVCVNEQDEKSGLIEYVPGEYCWRTLDAKGYIVIHCLYVFSGKTRKGYGKLLLSHVIGKSKGYHGLAIVTSSKPWVNDKRFFLKQGFKKVENAPPYFELLAMRFRDVPLPSFRKGWEDRALQYGKGITVFYSDQCPIADFAISNITSAAKELDMDLRIIPIDNYSAAQNAPSPC